MYYRICILVGLLGICLLGISGCASVPKEAVTHQKDQATTALTEIETHFMNVVNDSTDASGLSKIIETELDTPIKASGELGEVERFLKEYMKKVAMQRNSYISELSSIGWDDILNLNRLLKDDSFIESEAIIQRAKNTIKKYQKEDHELLSETRSSINTFDFSDRIRKEVIAQLDRSMANSKVNIDKHWSLVKRNVDEYENIISFLSRKKGSWIVDNNKILFYEISDLNTFNSYIVASQNLFAEQQRMRKEGVNKVSNKLRGAKDRAN